MKTVRLSMEQAVDHWSLIKKGLEDSLNHGVGESTLMDYFRSGGR